jgi:hypothetical protein
MNPYLEHPGFWPGVHHLLISEMVRLLSPQLRPKYRVAVEVRVYGSPGENSLLVGIPDVAIQSQRMTARPLQTNTATATNTAVLEAPTQPVSVEVPVPEIVKEGYLEVREVGTEDVVTTIELLSPTNKRGKGRSLYERKRQKVLGSPTNLVEIDLLQGGDPMPILGNPIASDYRILVCRGNCRPHADLYTFNLLDRIPAFPLPLRPEDNEPIVDLQLLLDEVYELSGYDRAIDYNREPARSLSTETAAWLDEILRDRNLRE